MCFVNVIKFLIQNYRKNATVTINLTRCHMDIFHNFTKHRNLGIMIRDPRQFTSDVWDEESTLIIRSVAM